MNSTIKPKKKKCQCGCGREGYIFSKGLLKECWAKQHSKPIKRVSDKRMERDFSEESWANLRDELDATFSKYIRIKYANSKGQVECYTCGKVDSWKNMDNGHCISRSDIGGRYLPENCRVQCKKCNHKHETHPEIFRNKLEQEKAGTLEYLDSIAHSITKLSTSDLKELLIEYRAKLELVKLKLIDK